jgi:hypothetical protein
MHAEEIEEYLSKKGVDVSSSSIQKYKPFFCGSADYVVMGC